MLVSAVQHHESALYTQYPLLAGLPPTTPILPFQIIPEHWAVLPALYSSFLLLLLSHVSRVQLCVTPQGAAHQAPVPGILQARTLGWGCHCLLPLPASYLFHMVVYICQCYDLSSSYPFLPHLCSQVCSLCLCLYCVCVCVCVCARSVVSDSLWFPRLCQAPLSMEFSRQEYWNGFPFPSPVPLLLPCK